MNTSHLKRFAQEARRKLISQVGARLELVLTTDSIALREKAAQLRMLREELHKTSKEQLIEKVAYTWFNRLMALRFMDVNDYQPLNLLIVTPRDGYTLPEILHEAKQGFVPDELPGNRQHIFDLLDGKIPMPNPQNEAYKELLIGACNYLHKLFPFMFERISDYTELLLPEDLTSEFSIVYDIREGMKAADCKQVEIIGWLYQFYISERKDELINAKKKYKANEIAPVTQLFTPKWIVDYMVDNTLGQFWNEARSETKVTEKLKYFIKSNNPELIPVRKVKSPEEIKFFDPCVGSAHVLCYAFDVFYKIYEEEGYNPSEVAELIITKNLFGIDIDDRAAQLAGFALMMKGRQYDKRFLDKQIFPKVTAFQNVDDYPKFEHAKSLGSLIKVTQEEANAIKIESTSLFAERNKQLKMQASMLAEEYDIVVTNPPYLNSAYMDTTLKQFVEKEYKDTKADLFASFLIRAINLAKQDGFIGFISPYVWMFISSYEKLREELIKNTTVTSLIQLEYNAFEPACVPIATFTLRNSFIDSYKGSYVKLSDFRGHETQAPKTLEAIQNPDCGWFYVANQNDFQKIPGSPIGYWLSEGFILSFVNNPNLRSISKPYQGMSSSNNYRFLRFWHEVVLNTFKDNCKDEKASIESGKKWFPYNKGGGFRRWYGNYDYVVNWYASGRAIKEFTSKLPQGTAVRVKSYEHYFKPSITWSALTAGIFGARISDKNAIFDVSGSSVFPDEKTKYTLLGIMNSKYTLEALNVLNPTLNFQVIDVSRIPINKNISDDIISVVKRTVELSRKEWNSRETSWDFLQNELIRFKSQQLRDAYTAYRAHWTAQFFQLHQNEEELNRQFIGIYGLQDELTPDVPIEDITILQKELDRTALKELNNKLVREEGSMKVLNYDAITLTFEGKEIMAQLISYAVGCKFGRYSLQKEGLILANQGEDLADYLQKLEIGQDQCTFLPDEDNIIPVLDEEWFEDDIVTRFQDFLKVAFGSDHFEENLAFIEQQLGKPLRKYFTRDFYTDHVRRYKKRPIYWLFSSGSGTFSVLIYLHRYTPDTVNNILNKYLRQFQEKIRNQMLHLDNVMLSGSASEQSKASREKDRLNRVLMELQEYEREVIYPMATDRIPIDLDDGVLVNYNKFGKAVKEISGLNDKKTKAKVKQFDWIDQTQIR